MKADPKIAADAPAGSNKKKKLIIILVAALLVLGGGGGGAAWFFLHDSGKSDEHVKEVKTHGPPVFMPIETFTVNLQSEGEDQFLQTTFMLQMQGDDQVERIKVNMPKVRNRLLMLLSSKKASEINTIEGKKQLAAEIIAQIKLPFDHNGPEQEVTDVLFSSFIIQ